MNDLPTAGSFWMVSAERVDRLNGPGDIRVMIPVGSILECGLDSVLAKVRRVVEAARLNPVPHRRWEAPIPGLAALQEEPSHGE